MVEINNIINLDLEKTKIKTCTEYCCVKHRYVIWLTDKKFGIGCGYNFLVQKCAF